MQGCQGLSQTGEPMGEPWFKLRVFPLDGTLHCSDNSVELSNSVILRKNM